MMLLKTSFQVMRFNHQKKLIFFIPEKIRTPKIWTHFLSQDPSWSLHISLLMSRKYPTTRSIPVLTSAAAPGGVLASGNMGHSPQYKTSVFLSADAGLSWHQVLQGNYYYNIGDHGGVIWGCFGGCLGMFGGGILGGCFGVYISMYKHV